MKKYEVYNFKKEGLSKIGQGGFILNSSLKSVIVFE